MKAPSRILLRTAVIGALASSSSWAQQSPGLSAKPSGRTLSEPTAPPAEQPVDLSRPNPQQAVQSTPEEDTYFDAAMQGQVWAQTKLGRLYTESPDDALRWDKGVELLKKNADQDDAEALLTLSRLTARGEVMPQSLVQSFEYCSRAARLGSVEAQLELAGMYSEGHGALPDKDAALSWIRRAAAQGDTPAKYSLALALLERGPDSEFTSEAISWLTEAANEGHRDALFFLAGATAHGDYGLTKDEKKAAEMALPSAEAGDAEFQFALATLYLKGEVFGEERDEGIKWLKRAARNGQHQAQQMLGEFESNRLQSTGRDTEE